jgi:uncharacterized protein
MLNKKLDQALSSDELVTLNKLLTDRGGLSVFATHGLLCAMISGPHILPSNLWLNVIWGEEKDFNAMEEVETLTNLIMRLNNEIAFELRHHEYFVPLVDYARSFPFDDASLSEEQQKNIALWCQGYLKGVDLDVEGWQEKDGGELALLLLPIITIANTRKFKLSDISPKAKKPSTPEEDKNFIAINVSVIPDVTASIYDFWREQELKDTTVGEQRIGRNELCPCGSGKKLKKCCLINTTLH